MTDYRRIYIPGTTWFFTVNLAERRDNHLLVEKIDLLRTAFRYVKERKPYRIDAIVIMPDHLHCIWTLPPGDTDFSIRWNLIKGHFSRAIPEGERQHQAGANAENEVYGSVGSGHICYATKTILTTIWIISIGIPSNMAEYNE
jgi:REP element-mobilizing transposase RayT